MNLERITAAIVPTDVTRINHPEVGERHESPRQKQQSAEQMAVHKIAQELYDGQHDQAKKDLQTLLNGKTDKEKLHLAKEIRHFEGKDSTDALVIAPVFDQAGKKTGQSEIGVVDRSGLERVKKNGELIDSNDKVDKVESPHPFKDALLTLERLF